MVEKFRAELPQVPACFHFPAAWRHHLRKYVSRFPGCVDAAHSEQVLGCFLLAAEQMHA